ALMGEYGSPAPPKILKFQHHEPHPADMADLFGTRLALISEVKENSRLDEFKVKYLTGGDTIKARYMYGDFFKFSPTHKLWLYGNNKPDIRSVHAGMRRRLKLIPFTVHIPDSEKDPELPAKLREELPGILNWAIAGCVDWQRNGLRPAKVVLDATNDYF